MEEKTLIYLCLFAVKSGIFLIFLSNKLFQPELVNVSDITTDYNIVRIQGKITSLTVSKSETVFIKLTDSTGTIDVVVFKGTLDVSDFSEGAEVQIIGRPDLYKGKIEVIANDIQLLKSDLV